MMRWMAVLGFALLIGGGALGEGDRAFRRGDYRRAAEAYGRALAAGDSSATVRYNLGTTLLRLGRHDEARPHLEAAARLRRGRADLPVRAEYNAGNADLAPVAAGSVPREQRRERLLRAITRYRRALMLNPGDVDAKWNLELAQRLLREDAGGGGGDDEDDEQPRGGGGPGPQAPASPQPNPGQASEGGGRPMTREQAERILAGAERREQEIQRRQLRKDQARPHGIRDW